VLKQHGLALSGGNEFASVEPGAWYRLAMQHRDDRADACFLSCTTIRSVAAIEALERDLGMPVVTSNQAMAWHALRTGGVMDKMQGFGRLFREF